MDCEIVVSNRRTNYYSLLCAREGMFSHADRLLHVLRRGALWSSIACKLCTLLFPHTISLHPHHNGDTQYTSFILLLHPRFRTHYAEFRYATGNGDEKLTRSFIVSDGKCLHVVCAKCVSRIKLTECHVCQHLNMF